MSRRIGQSVLIITDFILYFYIMIFILKLYAAFIRRFINKKRNIRRMHSALQESHARYLDSAKRDTVQVREGVFRILPLKTPVFTEGDDLFAFIKSQLNDAYRKSDIITVAESIIGITEGRAYRLDELRLTPWAYLLYPWVSNVTYGTGLGMAETMQCAINEAGLKTILKATLYGAADRLRRRHGSFYSIAGPKVKSIDFKKEHPVPFRGSHNYIVLSPSDPRGFCRHVYRETGTACAVIDANNVSVDVMGTYPPDRISRDSLIELMTGNPAGQEGETTPIVILRPQ